MIELSKLEALKMLRLHLIVQAATAAANQYANELAKEKGIKLDEYRLDVDAGRFLPAKEGDK